MRPHLVALANRHQVSDPREGYRDADDIHQVTRSLQNRTFGKFVAICDGKDSIWNTARSSIVLAGATFVLDFCNAQPYMQTSLPPLRGGGKRHAVLRRAIKFLRQNLERMNWSRPQPCDGQLHPGEEGHPHRQTPRRGKVQSLPNHWPQMIRRGSTVDWRPIFDLERDVLGDGAFPTEKLSAPCCL